MIRISTLAVVLAVISVGCGGEDQTTPSSVAAPVANTTAAPVETTLTAPSTTEAVASSTTMVAIASTTVATTTSTTIPPTVCPIPPPLPEGTVVFAPVGGDFDGDGSADALQTYQAGADDWRVRIVFADGGGADTAVAGSDDFAPPQPVGGFDVDGDGSDEAFLTVTSGASAVFIGLYSIADCVATRITERGVPAEFAVGGSVGSVAGLSCDGDGTISRQFAQLVADDVYEGGFEPFVLDGSVLTPFPGDGAGFSAEEAFALAILDCGSLSLP